jgi:hypothetical protein
MYEFCPHCGRTPEQEQKVGQLVICEYCGKEIGLIRPAAAKVMVDGTKEAIRQGTAARCPVCRQAVEVRTSGTGRTIAPHFTAAPTRKVCPGSGKPAAASEPTPAPSSPAAPAAPKIITPSGKDLSAYMKRDVIRVVLCKKDAEPTIEELTLEYLDKADRVRLQIEALRDILGAGFRMQDYPPSLNRPSFAVWGHATACVVAKKHDQGGYQPMTEAEIAQVLADVKQAKPRFLS